SSRFSTDGYRRCRHRRIAQRQETGIEVRGSHPLKIATGGASRFRCGGVEFLQSQRVQLIPRPSTTMNSRLAMAPLTIHPVLRRMMMGSSRLESLIRLGRLRRPAFAPSVDGNADAIT